MSASPDFIAAPAAEVLLVSCYELGHEPLGLVVPAGLLARAGIRARLLDLAVEEFDADAVRGASLVGISVPMYTALRLGMRVARRVRAVNPRAHICFYGLYAGLNRDHLLGDLADSCLGAEFELPLLGLARRILSAPQSDPRTMVDPTDADPSLRSPGRDVSLRPARDALSHRTHYAHLALGDARHEVGYLQTTRGCKHLCTHCPLPPAYAGTFYAIPEQDVLADIDTLVARGARHITFADPDFLNGPGHALRITRAMAARHPGLTFDYTAKIEHLLRSPEIVDELQTLGSVFVVSALESMNNEVLRHLHKGHTRADALAVIRRFRARGLALRPSLVPFTPWETRASFTELLDTVASEGLVDAIDAVQYSIRLLLPAGSLLLDDPTVTCLLDGFDPAAPGHRWHHPDPEMDALQASIARIAEESGRNEIGARAAFASVCDRVSPGWSPTATRAPGPAPRLTESWFC
ncbi:MAG TPA: CUAEP/CCAEP-tail radical SAM protein [Candidatus Krumholzibacteria bacterium]|nr:CUAEP/CCAEP-tail radical SAM protein [Candidatus Krumholzibacteria bacterium]